MMAGSGRGEMILPAGFLPAEGFVTQAHPVFVRALAVGAERPLIYVSVEMTSLDDGDAAEKNRRKTEKENREETKKNCICREEQI